MINLILMALLLVENACKYKEYRLPVTGYKLQVAGYKGSPNGRNLPWNLKPETWNYNFRNRSRTL